MAFNPFEHKEMQLNEHETMLAELALVLTTPEGKGFIKYLLKHFGVAELPALAQVESIRNEHIGFLRAGQSIFEIVSQADSIKAGLILAEIQKEKYDATKS